jgi:hypothetical protein
MEILLNNFQAFAEILGKFKQNFKEDNSISQ